MFSFIGRILLGAFFIGVGSGQLSDPKKALAYAKSKAVWKPEIVVPFASYLLIISGFTIILGLPFLWFAKAFLIPFLIIVNYTMHAFWKETGKSKETELLFFMYNCALIGALLTL